MKVGDLVNVVQELGVNGIGGKRAFGTGLLIDIEDPRHIIHPTVGRLDLGRSVLVEFSDGIKRMHEKDCRVVS